MSDAEKKEGEFKKVDRLTLPVTDRKVDSDGNEIGGFEGQQVSWDSTRKKMIEQGQDEE